MKERDLEESLRDRSVMVVAEIPITNSHLHQIAEGKCCSLTKPGEIFGVRFLPRGSFKASSGNYIIHQFNMQVLALGKDNAMRKEEIKPLIKYVTREKSRKEKKELPKFEMEEQSKPLF